MKDFLGTIGLFLCIFGAIFLALFVAASGIYRFSNPELTETQLMLWSLERWWGWLPPMVVMGGGFWLVSRSKK